jgi:alanyl-tRNA synthetase
VGATGFLGYDRLRASSVVVGLVSGGQAVAQAEEGDDVEVALVETPFYPEGGGQVGDTGDLAGPEGKVSISDTQTVMPGLIMHIGRVAAGKISLGDSVDAHVNAVRRQDTARNHTATHLLHAGLRQVLGAHVRQAGSLVAPDRLRFDFSHVEAMTAEQIEQVQLLVNEKIRQNAGVHRDEDTYASAIRRGALAFFGDKYDERVRLVEISNGATFSFEVCGGTHVAHTGELGALYIMGESSIGSGMRRIEAVSGRGAERVVRDRFGAQSAVASLLQAAPAEVEGKVRALMDEVSSLRRANEALERRLSLGAAKELLESKLDVDGVTVLAQRVTVSSVDALREMGDWLRDKLGGGVVVLGSVIDERPLLIAMVTPDLVEDGLNAVEIARGAAKAIQGGGGGRPEVAQAGGRRADKLDEALALVPGLVRNGRAGQ